jgi:hypothetical protein
LRMLAISLAQSILCLHLLSFQMCVSPSPDIWRK